VVINVRIVQGIASKRKLGKLILTQFDKKEIGENRVCAILDLKLDEIFA